MPELIPVKLPESQQAAVSDAVACLLHLVKPLLAASKPVKKAKGFTAEPKAPLPDNRFGIELPVAGTDASTSMQLTADILSTLSVQLRAAGARVPSTVVVFADEAAAAAAQRAGATRLGSSVTAVHGLRDACRLDLEGLLLVVGPSVADVALLEQLLDEAWAGPAVVVINPEWAQQGVAVPQEYTGLVSSIGVVYSFLPCAIKGLLGNKEGAVLRTVEKGQAVAKAPWRILYQLNDTFVQVGSMPRRPKADDLELAFINASAATSPLTKAAKFFKGFGGKK